MASLHSFTSCFGIGSSSQVKSRITLWETWSRRQAGAMMPVRRAGWVLAASGAPAARAAWTECTCAGAAHKHFSLILCCVSFFFLVPVPPAQRDEARRVEV